MPRPSIEVARAGRERWVKRRIEAGELVPNAPFRERIEFLLAHDPEFTLNIVCQRLVDHGYPRFVKPQRPTKRHKTLRMTGDTSHLQRLLGMRDQASCTKVTKTGETRRYNAPTRTTHIEYEVAVALCRALDMYPTDCGV
jgi:hypothetical protein